MIKNTRYAKCILQKFIYIESYEHDNTSLNIKKKLLEAKHFGWVIIIKSPISSTMEHAMYKPINILVFTIARIFQIGFFFQKYVLYTMEGVLCYEA
jgi:hypothetical protein